MNKLVTFFQRLSNIKDDKLLVKKYYDKQIIPTVNASTTTYYNQQRKNPSKIICFAPFKNMYFSRHGEVFVCCHNRNYAIGKYPTQNIKEIWNGEKAIQIRQHIVQNNLSMGCQICQLDIDKQLYSEVKANHFDQLPLHLEYPTMMEFELDITCNLECTMCSGEFSSSIRKNREFTAPFVSNYDDTFVEQLTEFIPYLHETRFSGGEPFLIPIYLTIWEKIVSINPSCLISLQTNGTVLNSKIKSILEKGRFEIGISLDSLQKDIFEAIRVNAKFETVRQNINYFSDYCKRKKTPLRFSMCVMRNNWKEMAEYLDFCYQHNAYASFHKVSQPIELGIRYLNSDELNKIYIYLKAYQFNNTFDTYISQQNLKHYYNYVEQIRIWRDKQIVNEQKRGNDLDKLKQDLFHTVSLNLSDNKQQAVIFGKLNEILCVYSEETQKKLLLKLQQTDVLLIIQRIQFFSKEDLIEEIKTLYGICR